ncbi:PspC domain-containing protein [Bifidobacterium pullorum subsp. saeculare]|uniref:PspC domain-containing protein n=1 Tax=Bifidobacterium pullorum subsp. saeculare TaxID=78257 RepID=A0A939B8C8_9BIFI|nr:PspC domain-containing protein [Bifidobacterium pullorum]MBM6699782.1 PspC domain-containing protein [Bifidobacterium pullorum subsp. saeculare]
MSKSNRFFTWIRTAQIVRGDDRWIGGVCSGLAQRLGWSPTLVRALMVASVLLFGFGAALYAIGWLLLPDVRTGRILIEDLFAGHWEWDCLGGFLCLAVAVAIPGAGLLALALAAFVLWFLIQSSHRQQEGYGYAYRGGPGTSGPHGPGTNGPGMNGPGMNGPGTAWQGPNGQGAPWAGPAGTAANGPIPPDGQWAGAGQTAGGPAAADRTAVADGTAAGTVDASPASAPQSASQTPYVAPTAGSAFGPAAGAATAPASGPAPTQPPYAAPVPTQAPYAASAAMPAAAMPAPAPAQYADPAPERRRYARRKPAGPLIVLFAMGAALLSGAIVAAAIAGGFVTTDTGAISLAAVWSAALCLVLGVVLVALGLRGRRTGGLHPLVWTAAFVACVMLAVTVLYGAMVTTIDRDAANYAQVRISGDATAADDQGMTAARTHIDSELSEHGDDYWVAAASPQTMASLSKGVFLIGDGYGSTRANLDLSDWSAWQGGAAGSCPVGQINLAVRDTRAQVTLPDGCRFAFGPFYNGSIGPDRLGDGRSVLLDNGTDGLLFFGDPYGYDHDYDDPNYRWRDHGYSDDADDVPMDTKHYLFINLVGADHGSVQVRYASDSTWPGYDSVGKERPARVAGITTERHSDDRHDQ